MKNIYIYIYVLTLYHILPIVEGLGKSRPDSFNMNIVDKLMKLNLTENKQKVWLNVLWSFN